MVHVPLDSRARVAGAVVPAICTICYMTSRSAQVSAQIAVLTKAAPAMQALYNLCKVTKEQQTEASAADISPVLAKLVSRRPASLVLAGSASLNSDAGSGSVGLVTPADAQTAVDTRAVCIRLLCLLAHSSAHTRDQLWMCQGLDIFMDLLCEQVRRPRHVGRWWRSGVLRNTPAPFSVFEVVCFLLIPSYVQSPFFFQFPGGLVKCPHFQG